VFEQSPRHDATALENELRLSLHQDRSDLEHPAHRGQANPGARYLAKDAHELGVRQRVRRGNVDHTIEVFVLEQPLFRLLDFFEEQQLERHPT
jgi:hypothetical protein